MASTETIQDSISRAHSALYRAESSVDRIFEILSGPVPTAAEESGSSNGGLCFLADKAASRTEQLESRLHGIINLLESQVKSVGGNSQSLKSAY